MIWGYPHFRKPPFGYSSRCNTHCCWGRFLILRSCKRRWNGRLPAELLWRPCSVSFVLCRTVWDSGSVSFAIGATWRFPKMVVPPNRWFIRENPIKIDDLGGFPLFEEIPTWADLCWSVLFFMVWASAPGCSKIMSTGFRAGVDWLKPPCFKIQGWNSRWQRLVAKIG